MYIFYKIIIIFYSNEYIFLGYRTNKNYLFTCTDFTKTKMLTLCGINFEKNVP